MNINQKIKYLLSIYTKIELSEKLGITRATLDVRIEKNNWKKLEIEKIIKLSK